MKQFKNAVAVAIAAAGLYSVSAMASNAVHWTDSEAGTAKTAVWKVVQPSLLNFTVDTYSINGIDSGSDRTRHNGNDTIGVWRNDGDPVTIDVDEVYRKPEAGVYDIVARGDAGGEHLDVNMTKRCSTYGCDDFPYKAKAGESGVFNAGLILTCSEHNTSCARHKIEEVKSTRFVANMTVTKYTQ